MVTKRLASYEKPKNYSLKRHFGHLHSLETLAKKRILHAFHHLACLNVLFEELIDLLDAGAAALGDSFRSTAVDDLMIPALFRRHRIDHRLDSNQFLLVNLHFLQIFEGADARK